MVDLSPSPYVNMNGKEGINAGSPHNTKTMNVPLQNQGIQVPSASSDHNPQFQQHIQVHTNSRNRGYGQEHGYCFQDRQGFDRQRVNDIETSINTEFGCYTCVIYFELITCSLGLILSLASPGYNPYSGGVVFLQFLISSCLVLACGLVLSARQSFKSEKQRIALIAFYTALGFDVLNMFFASSKYENQKYTGDREDESIALLSIPIAAIFYYLLISNTQIILELMREREKLLGSKNDVELQASVDRWKDESGSGKVRVDIN